MSNPVRTEDQIKADYAQLCAKKGELAYQIEQLELQSKEITKSLMNLNQEFHSLAKKEEAPASPVVEEPNVSTQG